VLRVLCAASVAAIVSLIAPRAAPAEDVCISQAVKDAAAACPALPIARPVTPAFAPSLDREPLDRGFMACMDQDERVRKSRTQGDKAVIIRELDRLVDIHRRVQKEGIHSEETRYICANITAALLFETAMEWHVRAVGGGHESNRDGLMRLATQLYEKILDHFTAEQIASFDYPHIAKNDWPSRWRIQFAMADLYYFLKDWAKCGPAFDMVVVSAPDKPAVEEAVFAAALCHYNHYEATHPPPAAGTKRKLTREAPRQLPRRSRR
jgi:hypothetical protein